MSIRPLLIPPRLYDFLIAHQLLEFAGDIAAEQHEFATSVGLHFGSATSKCGRQFGFRKDIVQIFRLTLEILAERQCFHVQFAANCRWLCIGRLIVQRLQIHFFIEAAGDVWHRIGFHLRTIEHIHMHTLDNGMIDAASR